MVGKSKYYSLNRLLGLANIFVFVVVANTEVQRDYVIELTKVDCRHNTSDIRALECSMRNDTRMYMRLELATTVQDFRMRSMVQIYRKGMPRLTLYDVTMNACEFLETIHKQKIFVILLNTIKRYFNADPRCPFRKDFNYTLTGLQLDAKDFPAYFPEGEFTAHNYVNYQNKFVAKVSFSGRVVYLKKGNAKRRHN